MSGVDDLTDPEMHPWKRMFNHPGEEFRREISNIKSNIRKDLARGKRSDESKQRAAEARAEFRQGMSSIGKGIGEGLRAWNERVNDDSVVVKTYTSNSQMQRSAKKMIADGYRIAGQSGQFNEVAFASWRHTVTVTWVREPSAREVS